MPTRNREQHLPSAIASVLGQTFADFELIVSDNFSVDNTPHITQSFGDKRVKYFRSDQPLDIGDSYEFALSHARGEHIAFLSDDDAYTATALQRLSGVIRNDNPEVITFRGSVYFRDEEFDFDRTIPSNTLAITPYSGRLATFSSADAMGQLFQNFGLNGLPRDRNFIISYLSNAVFRASVIEKIKKVKAKIFAATPADIYLAAAGIFATKSYHCLDEPLYVWQSWKENTTASPHKLGSEIRVHYEKLLGGEPLRFTPLKFALHQNCCINAVLQAKEDFDKTDDAKVCWPDYYVFIHNNLMSLGQQNVDIKREMLEFGEVLSRENVAVRSEVERRIGSFKFRSKQFLKQFPAAARVAKRLSGVKAADPILVPGAASGFNNVLEAAAFLETYKLTQSARDK